MRCGHSHILLENRQESRPIYFNLHIVVKTLAKGGTQDVWLFDGSNGEVSLS
jgi:hypothetical protein